MPLRVALLRSMVVNGRRVTGEDARMLAEDAGATDARSVLATGNIVFSSAKSPTTLTHDLEAACARRFGKPTEIIVKTEGQWKKLVAANPFKKQAKKTPTRVLLFVMRSSVTARGLAQLRRRAAPSEKIKRVVGGSFYIFFGRPNRDDTRIAAGFGLKALGAVGTNRTWTTVSKITALLDAMKADAK
jgi:uncharacterized protein (DUF1697 family)